jgi:hypothetical protein
VLLGDNASPVGSDPTGIDAVIVGVVPRSSMTTSRCSRREIA